MARLGRGQWGGGGGGEARGPRPGPSLACRRARTPAPRPARSRSPGEPAPDVGAAAPGLPGAGKDRPRGPWKPRLALRRRPRRSSCPPRCGAFATGEPEVPSATAPLTPRSAPSGAGGGSPAPLLAGEKGAGEGRRGHRVLAEPALRRSERSRESEEPRGRGLSEAAGPSEPRAAAALALTLAPTLAGLARRPAWRAHWHAPTLARTPPRALHTHALPRTRAAWPTAALARVRRAGIFPGEPPGRRRSPGGAQLSQSSKCFTELGSRSPQVCQ